MIAAVAIPVIANGIRAWGTIYIAHLTSNDFAAGFDHVLYGWFFFAAVIFLLMASGWRFFDRSIGEKWFDPDRLQPERPTSSSIVAVAAACLALAAVPVGWSAAIAAGGADVPAEIVLPQVPGWQQVDAASGRPWKPSYAGADLVRMGRYRNAAGSQIDVAIVLFARQEEGRELIGFGQGAADPSNGWAWTATEKGPPNARLDRIVSFGTVREVATFYRVGTILTGSPFEVKLETMKTRLLGGPQRAVAVLVSAAAPAEGVSPRPAMDAFIRALGPIDRLADAAAGLPQQQ
jgi:EpsI family protein